MARIDHIETAPKSRAMTEALNRFEPTRTAALERLQRFVPHAGRDYAARRNYDLGRDGHSGVSTLSPYIRARLITEDEVLDAVLARHSIKAAEKFIQEVYWRTYWKGWLAMRPGVWAAYQADLKRNLDDIQTQTGLRTRWEAACTGQTNIACFDAWAQELVHTGYLHNHARMWFASIWIFTLGLPWELGADFFLRHLLDGDPASNTLSWRWVAGQQTPGKTYLARASNIAKYTEGRFAPAEQLARDAQAIPGRANPERTELEPGGAANPHLRTGLILHDDDLSPGFILDAGIAPVATAVLNTRALLSPLQQAPHVAEFATRAAQDVTTRFGSRLGTTTPINADATALVAWAKLHTLDQIVTPDPPIGPNNTALKQFSHLPIRRVRRSYDAQAWPHATHGFFKFKDKIPSLLALRKGLRAAE